MHRKSTSLKSSDGQWVPQDRAGETDRRPSSQKQLSVSLPPPNPYKSSWTTCFHALFFMYSGLSFIKITLGLRSVFRNDLILFSLHFILIICCFIHPTPPHSKKSSEKDADLKTQVEKLWREVNALKEMQALQTGETRLTSTRWEERLWLARIQATSRVHVILGDT